MAIIAKAPYPKKPRNDHELMLEHLVEIGEKLCDRLHTLNPRGIHQGFLPAVELIEGEVDSIHIHCGGIYSDTLGTYIITSDPEQLSHSLVSSIKPVFIKSEVTASADEIVKLVFNTMVADQLDHHVEPFSTCDYDVNTNTLYVKTNMPKNTVIKLVPVSALTSVVDIDYLTTSNLKGLVIHLKEVADLFGVELLYKCNGTTPWLDELFETPFNHDGIRYEAVRHDSFVKVKATKIDQ